MNIPEAETSAVLESMGQDLLIFLTSSVLVTLVSNSIGISPILGYLVAGALLGPHGLDVFSNAIRRMLNLVTLGYYFFCSRRAWRCLLHGLKS